MPNSVARYWQEGVYTEAGTGLGSASQSVAFVVAAVNASPEMRNRADYQCDGVADEVEINAAMAALPAGIGGKVVMSEGTFTLADPITVPADNVFLQGQGDATFIDGDGLATGEHGILVPARIGCVLKDFSIQTEDGGAKVCHCIYATGACNGLRIEEITIVDSDADGIRIEPTNAYDIHVHGVVVADADGTGIYVDPTAMATLYRLRVRDCLVIGCGNNGIYLGNTGAGSAYLEIVGNLVFGAGGDGIHLTEIDHSNISRNIVTGCLLDGIELHTAEHLDVQGNIVCSCDNNGILATNCNESVFGNNLVWDCVQSGIEMGGTSVNDLITGNVCADNGSLGAFCGIDTTGCSYMTVVSNHCYNNRSYGIGFGVGAGGFNTITGNHCYFNYEDGIIGGGADSVLSGNFCYNNSQGAAGIDHGITLTNNCDRVSVIGNWCGDDSTNQEDGIHLEDGAVRCLIEGNYCFNLMGDGIYLAGNNTGTAIRGNHCYSGEENGITVLNSADCAVTDNYCEANVHHGIYLNNADGANVTGNTCKNNDRTNSDTYDGIYVQLSDGCVISSNICNGNDRQGIWIYRSDYCTVTANSCNDNGRDGIQVFGDGTANADYNTLTGNVCHGNTDDGIAIEGGVNTNKNIVTSNQLLPNTGTPLVDNGTATVTDNNIVA